ncbi:hypothetical protein HDU88_008438 [Geranomyces variabilis]|nr:hypothetical protein HDU88_008438 [Geranomyces variabilis]
MDRRIFWKLTKSPGVFRLFTNIALAIATLCQVADPNFSTNPKFGGMFSLWTGWQINTFVQFSFVETKELVEDFAAHLTAQKTNLDATGSQITKSEIRHAHGIRSEVRFPTPQLRPYSEDGGDGSGIDDTAVRETYDEEGGHRAVDNDLKGGGRMTHSHNRETLYDAHSGNH